jgi:hypothetical protein
MNTKHIFATATVASVLALASPVYAGRLGGAGGLGGNLNGFAGPSGLGGTGSFGSQGSLNGSLSAVNTKPVAKTANKIDDTTKSTQTATKSAQATAATTPAATTSAVTSTAAAAPAVTSPAATARNVTEPSTPAAQPKSASAPPVAAAAKPNGATDPAKRGPSAGLSGSADQMVTTGGHSASGNADGSLDAQHSNGTTSGTVAAGASGSLN